MLLIKMQQTFGMFRHLTGICDQQLKRLRNRIENSLLSASQTIASNLSATSDDIDKQYNALAADFGTSIQRMIGERQKSATQMTMAFERGVDKSLPNTRGTAKTIQQVKDIQDLTAKTNDQITELVAATRRLVDSTTAARLAELRKTKEGLRPTDDWPKQLQRQTAQLVVDLHAATDKQLEEGKRQLQEFEVKYSDLVRAVIANERDAATALQKKAV